MPMRMRREKMNRLNRVHPPRALVAPLLLLTAMACAARAPEVVRTRAPSYLSFWSPSIGSGAVYEVETPGQRRTLIEITVPGRQQTTKHDGFWAEISSQAEGNSLWLIGKARLRVDRKHRQLAVTRLIMQWPGFPPMDLSENMRGLGSFAQDFVGVISGYRDVYMPPPGGVGLDIPNLTIDTEVRLHAEVPKAKDLGRQTVSTPAGVFSCEHFKFAGKAGEVWVSKAAAPFGIVRAATNGTTMILSRLFTGVSDRIEVAPEPFRLEMLLSVPKRFGGSFWDWVLLPAKP